MDGETMEENRIPTEDGRPDRSDRAVAVLPARAPGGGLG